MRWNAQLYDTNHQFVSGYGSDVIKLLNPNRNERVLDVGCGTGDLCYALMRLGCEVTGIDASIEMIEKAQAKYPDMKFLCENATDFNLKENFDAVFSNAALHWIPAHDHRRMLKCIRRHLANGGRFVAEMGAAGNVEKIRTTVSEVLREKGFMKQAETETWYFPEEKTYGRLLEEVGFNVSYIKVFDRPTVLADGNKGITKWLEMFGKNWFVDIPEDEIKLVVSEAGARLYPELYKAGNWIADYRRLRFCAVV